jgi:hypothetical protein
LWVNNKATGQKVIHERNVTETSFTPGPEMSAGTYAVWVRAWNGNTPGEWSRAHNFTLTPGTPIVTGPLNTDDSTPTFTWTSASNATRYELWVNNKVTRQRVLHQTNLTETSHTSGSDLAAGTYTVWVRAWNGDVPGAWSPGRDFTVTPTINIDDPNGPNNTWQQATLLRHLGFGVGLPSVKHDRLTQNDKSDFFKVTWDRSRTHVSISLKVSVTEGDVADLRVKVYRLYNGVLSEITVFNQSRSGNTVTLSSNPMIVNSRFTGLYYEVTSVTGKANLSYRIEG